MHTPVCQNTFAFFVQLLYINDIKKENSFGKKNYCMYWNCRICCTCILFSYSCFKNIGWHFLTCRREKLLNLFFFFWLLNCNIVDRFFFFLFSLIGAFCTGFLCVCVRVCVNLFLIHSYPLCLSYHCLPGYLKQVHTFEKRKKKKCCFKKCFLLLQ